MGSSAYSADVFRSTVTSHARAGTDYFTHTAAISSGKVTAAVNEKLDPSKPNKAGKIVREALDSDTHPVSNPVAVLFDVTGSMSNVPREFVSKLGNLMQLLVKKNYLDDPQVLFGAIGDATTDRAPLQLGQFESGNEMDEALGLIYLEGGGGGHITESYELGMYFLARHAKLDSLDKRGKKGYLFLSGDEIPYTKVSKDQVKRVIGDDLEADIPLTTILEELREKFEVFWIFPKGTNHWDDDSVINPLEKLFGQNLLRLEEAKDVCELIASTIGVCEGFDVKSIESDLISTGSTAAAAKNAITAITPFAASNSALARKTGTVEGDLGPVGTDTVERL